MNSLMSQFEQAQYYVLTNPKEWLISAEGLYHSYKTLIAEVDRISDSSNRGSGEVFKQMQLHKNGDMLIGFAIENVLKGILLHFSKDFVEIKYDKDQHDGSIKDFKKTFFNWPGSGGHDLCAIANKIIELDPELLEFEQQDFVTLHRLTGSITWAGRYPSNLVKKNGGLSHHGPVRHDAISLYERCYLALRSLIKY